MLLFNADPICPTVPSLFGRIQWIIFGVWSNWQREDAFRIGQGDLTVPSQLGIIPRACSAIFAGAKAMAAEKNVVTAIKLTAVEIYNEKIKDLMRPENDNLQVQESKNAGANIVGAVEAPVQDSQELLQLIRRCTAARSTSSTNMNAKSSRSHVIFIIMCQAINRNDGMVTTGRLYMVDLAGSEKCKKTGAKGSTLLEATNINQSLSALGNVISGLSDGRSTHIPYRDSKLTRCLQQSLGGNSKTTLLCCLSPSSSEVAETLSTLRFGARAKNVVCKPVINVEKSTERWQQDLQKAEETIASLQAQVVALQAHISAGSEAEPSADEDSRLHCIDAEAPTTSREEQLEQECRELRLCMESLTDKLVETPFLDLELSQGPPGIVAPTPGQLVTSGTMDDLIRTVLSIECQELFSTDVSDLTASFTHVWRENKELRMRNDMLTQEVCILHRQMRRQGVTPARADAVCSPRSAEAAARVPDFHLPADHHAAADSSQPVQRGDAKKDGSVGISGDVPSKIDVGAMHLAMLRAEE
eukprot:jgi/Mesvir1/27584/Mv07328-RA.1